MYACADIEDYNTYFIRFEHYSADLKIKEIISQTFLPLSLHHKLLSLHEYDQNDFL
jgi:hypothetical protein